MPINNNTRNNIFIGIVVVIFCASFLLLSRSCKNNVKQPILDANALKYSNDSLRSVNNAVVMDLKAFKAAHLGIEDSLTKIIQAQASKNTIAITAISTKVSSETSGKTSVTPGTVQVKGDSVLVYPTYTYSKSDSSEDVQVTATKDSTHARFTLFNKQVIESKFVPSGFLGLGPKSIVLDVSNSNPHIRTTNQVSFVKPLPKPKRLVWLGVGVGLGASTILYLKK